MTPRTVAQYPLYKVCGPSSIQILTKTCRKVLKYYETRIEKHNFQAIKQFTYLYPVYLSVTAIRALAKSNGYVKDWEVMPANEPAKKRFTLVL